jgi:hypothetical protein
MHRFDHRIHAVFALVKVLVFFLAQCCSEQQKRFEALC